MYNNTYVNNSHDIFSYSKFVYIISTGHKKEWGSWGPCNTTCGIGWRVRYRACPTCERKVHVQSEPCVVQYYCPGE